MTNANENLQAVFDCTDWNAFRYQKGAARAVKRITCESLIPGSTEIGVSLDALANWLEAIELAAEMDGYQLNNAKEPTQ